MIYLFATTDIIRTTSSAAATVDIVLNYVEAVTATGAVSGFGRALKSALAAASDDTLAGPGSSGFRTLKQGTWRNTHATVATDITVAYRVSGPTDYEMHKTTLQPGESLIYIEGIGFFLNKVSSLLDKIIIMASDSTHATAATFADIAGMTCPLLSGKKYAIEAHLFHTNNASTTGSQFSYNIGNAPTVSLFGNYSAVTNSVTAGTMATGTATARDTAITAQTTGQTATGYTVLGGMIQPSADGTFALRATSEVTVASGLVVKAGSWMAIRQER